MKFLKLAVAALFLFVAVPSMSPAHAAGDDAVVTVVWSSDSTSVTVASTKDLSNVVLEDCSGARYKHDGLDGHEGTFEHPSGEAIVTVWVKSGNNKSGDGPGYGERFDNPDETVCDEEETTTTTIPETTTTTIPETTTTTVPETTTTTAPVVTTTTVPTRTIPTPVVPPAVKQLPRTGSPAQVLAGIGTLSGLTGLMMLLSTAVLKRRKNN